MAAKGRRVLYQETAAAIRAQITSGHLPPGEQVGSSLTALAADHHVGIGTMRAALTILSDEGLVETIPGKGTFVLASAREAPGGSGEVAALAKRVEALEVDVMELHDRLGQDQRSRKVRHERTG